MHGREGRACFGRSNCPVSAYSFLPFLGQNGRRRIRFIVIITGLPFADDQAMCVHEYMRSNNYVRSFRADFLSLETNRDQEMQSRLGCTRYILLR